MLARSLSLWLAGAATLLAGCPYALGKYPAVASGVAFAAVTQAVDPSASGVAMSAPPSRSLTVTRSADGLFYVNARVNGIPVRFLVDTGSNLVVLTAADAKRACINPDVTHSSGNLDTAAGISRMEKVRLDSVSVAGQNMSDMEAAVIHSNLQVSLLGQNILSKLGRISISGDEMTLQTGN
jgi:aspartyl protease family protein